jgi:hypothetical protein
VALEEVNPNVILDDDHLDTLSRASTKELPVAVFLIVAAILANFPV